MSIVNKLVEGYQKNGMRVEVKDTPAWMNGCDKMVVVFRGEKFIMTLHCINTKEDRIVATF